MRNSTTNTRLGSSIPSGHAPGDVRDAFLEGVHCLIKSEPASEEPRAELRGQLLTFSELCDLLWSCDDTLPGDVARDVEDMTGEPVGCYAAAARALKDLLEWEAEGAAQRRPGSATR